MNCNFSFGAMQSSESQVSPEYLSMLNDNFAGENNANFEGITSGCRYELEPRRDYGTSATS